MTTPTVRSLLLLVRDLRRVALGESLHLFYVCGNNNLKYPRNPCCPACRILARADRVLEKKGKK
jgi:hypothetical protein